MLYYFIKKLPAGSHAILPERLSSSLTGQFFEPMPPSRPSHFARLVDRFGATASFLCAIHCALLPLVVAALPVLGLGFLADHRYERGFIVFASVLALTSIALGFRRHQRFGAFWFLVPGIVLLLVGAAIALDDATNLHAVIVAIGGTLVAAAHVVNLRLSHHHVHDANCQH